MALSIDDAKKMQTVAFPSVATVLSVLVPLSQKIFQIIVWSWVTPVNYLAT